MFQIDNYLSTFPNILQMTLRSPGWIYASKTRKTAKCTNQVSPTHLYFREKMRKFSFAFRKLYR